MKRTHSAAQPQLNWLRIMVVVALWMLLAGCTTPAAPTSAVKPERPDVPAVEVSATTAGVRHVRIANQRTYWQARGFRTLTPVVRVSLPSAGMKVAVFLRLPAEGHISVSLPTAGDGLARLRWPADTEADRVTYQRHGGGWTVADVRGSRIDEHRRENFHVYRPTTGSYAASLVGYEWLRSDSNQRQVAHRLLLEHVGTTPRASEARPPSNRYVRHFGQLLECEHCHQPNKPGSLRSDAQLPLWPTDSVGWYVPQSVLRTGAELSATSDFHDPNAGDPFVGARCTNGAARIERDGDTKWYRCPDSRYGAMGELDLARALTAGQSRAKSLCASRQWLWTRMDEEARRHFASMVALCPEDAGALKIRAP